MFAEDEHLMLFQMLRGLTSKLVLLFDSLGKCMV